MNAVPAKVAGVPRIVMVVPTPGGRRTRWCSRPRGSRASTRSTASAAPRRSRRWPTARRRIAPVAKIVGPGNAYVAAAKRRVFGQVGIDMIAGPSEVLILADGHANPDWIAADLLAQAEHDPAAQSILVTDSRRARRRRRARPSSASWPPCPRAEIAAGELARLRRDRPWCATSPRRCPLVDRLAPEHLEIEAEDAEALAAKVRNAGAIFLGSPHARGDRRLRRRPQPRAADRPLGPLLVGARRARLHEAHDDPALRRRRALRALGPAAIALGRAEGLEGHARSVAIRLNL